MIGHILNICAEQKQRIKQRFTQSESVTRQRLPYSEMYIRVCAYEFKKWLINAYAKCFKRRNISVKNNDVR
jgi:hypothetical protein